MVRTTRGRLLAPLLGVLALMLVAPATAHAADDRIVTGTVVVDSGEMAVPPVLSVRVKACKTDGTAPTCLGTPAGQVDATLVSADSTPNRQVYAYSLQVDPAAAYVIGRFVNLNMVDAASPDNSPRIVAFSPNAGNVASLAAGPDPVAAPTMEVDARYFELSGAVTYTGDANLRPGVGACPAASPRIGNSCAGLAVTFERPDHRYLLRLLPGHYRAAGFTLSGGPSPQAQLGIVNVLPLSSPPPTAAAAQLTLDFNADMVTSTAAVEDAGPNAGDGNYDGTLDSQQVDVASVRSTTTGKYVTIVGPAPVSSAVAQPLTALLAAPPEADMTSGLTSFTVGPIDMGSSIDVQIIFEEDPAPGTEFWKYVGGTWGQYPNTPVTPPGSASHAIVVNLTDGGAGDYDGQVNGYVTDPFAIARPPFQLSALTLRSSKGATHVSWQISAGGAPVAVLPPASTLVAVCNGGTVNLISKVEADGAGGFQAVVPAGKKRESCVVTLEVPKFAQPNGPFLVATVSY